MLIQFRVANHRSLRDEQTLSLVASNIGSTDGHIIRPSGLGEALLPAVAVYGANASGKTNVLLALFFMQTAVVTSHRLWEPETGVPQEPFALSEHKNSPSFFEVDILLYGIRHRYGFTLDGERIREEWLYAWPNARRQMWFEREDDHFDFGKNFRGDNETIRGLTRANSLFLSAGAQNNHVMLLPIFAWFQRLRFEIHRARAVGGRTYFMNSLMFQRLFDDTVVRQASLFSDEDTIQKDRDAIIRLLREADTGIVGLRVETQGGEDQRGRLSRRISLYFQHKAVDVDAAWLPLEAESAGTVTLLDLSTRLVPTLRTGGVLCVDELESSLHPMLAVAILHQFCDRQQNPNGAQLIFTTHDTNLLGNTLGPAPLRRDQIWFTEKDDVGASHLYPLTDFHPRKEENLERGYLQGRYGAVPFLGGLVHDDGNSAVP